MAIRNMIDSTSKNFDAVFAKFPDPVMWAGYDTGTPDVIYTNQWAKLPKTCEQVYIDQGYNSPAVTTSTVRDVELNAWNPASAVNRSNWKADRPTIYCDMDDLNRAGGILDSGWTGDLWLAIPGSAPSEPPIVKNCTVVAVQYALGVDGIYDESVVFDEYWPNKPPEINMPTILGQDGWKYCFKCTGLFYGPQQSESHCPAGGQHDDSKSGNYVLIDVE